MFSFFYEHIIDPEKNELLSCKICAFYFEKLLAFFFNLKKKSKTTQSCYCDSIQFNMSQMDCIVLIFFLRAWHFLSHALFCGCLHCITIIVIVLHIFWMQICNIHHTYYFCSFRHCFSTGYFAIAQLHLASQLKTFYDHEYLANIYWSHHTSS